MQQSLQETAKIEIAFDAGRYIAEEMIPELEDFEKRKYFTKAEVKHMVKKRLHFEYLLKRKIPLKADFLR